ncbi:MAG TPA: hypothetical protein VHT75_20315 [Acidimicrobiales bacterium]|jgi:hypothetical protein|nr:hypothetical protein [Acidimicrobiales bacterium]
MGNARGYSWPPFEVGNTARLRHGADSERIVRPLADRLAAAIVIEAPWLSRPAFAAALAAWSRAEARVLLVSDWLDEHGLLDSEGRPFPAATFADKLEARAGNARAQLGLDPQSFAKLMATIAGIPGAANEIEALRREGAAILAAQAARGLAAPALDGHGAE